MLGEYESLYQKKKKILCLFFVNGEKSFSIRPSRPNGLRVNNEKVVKYIFLIYLFV